MIGQAGVVRFVDVCWAASTVWPGPRAMCFVVDKLRLPKRDETNERIGNLGGDAPRVGADRGVVVPSS